MSVPSYERSESRAQFLQELHELCVRCGQIVMRKPTKYRATYGDRLINSCLDALQNAQFANHIYITKDTSAELKNLRKVSLTKARNLCYTIPSLAQIFLDLVGEIDGGSSKLAKEKAYFGEKCGTIVRLIDGVLENDKKFSK